MKTMYFILGLVLGAIMLQSCDNDDDFRHSGNELIEIAFAKKYPEASRTDWERKGDYSVVDFYQNGIETEAWFDQNGNWYLTETNLGFNALPTAIKEAFLAGDYATWRVDDIDVIERRDMETVYVLEVESGKQEYNLYYSVDGTLIKAVADVNNNSDNGHYLPKTINNAITTYITAQYPQARILEIENENGMTEVDIIDGNIHRELMFKANGDWVYTKTGIRKNQVPQNVIGALEKSAHASYTIDDIYYYETPQRNYYYFELESRSKEVELIITIDGVIEIVRISND